LILSNNIPALEWIRECHPQYDLILTFNLTQRKEWDQKINNDNCYFYQLSVTRLTLIGDDDAARKINELYRSWLSSYELISNWINHQRKRLGNNFEEQNTIYQIKVEEASNILDNKLDNIVFLKNESILKKISMKNLAEQVILQHDMRKGFLLKTELIRVKWLNILKTSYDVNQHKKIISEFQKEMYEYHRLS
jgi:hypothetical protein